MDAKTKRVFKFVFILQLIDLLAFTLILPLLPKILDYYSKNDSSGFYNKIESLFTKLFSRYITNSDVDAQNQVLLAGLLGSWFSLLQFVSSPMVGALSDRFGRKPMLLLTMLGSMISYGIWYFAYDSFGLFVLSRTIGGLSKATVGLSLAMIGDVADENSRGKGMALIGSSFSLAFILGPSLGAYMSTLQSSEQFPTQLITNPSLIAFLLTILNIVFILAYLEETNQNQMTSIQSKRDSNREEKQPMIRNGKLNRVQASQGNFLDYINPTSLFSFRLVKPESRRQAHILLKTGVIYFQYLLFYSGLEFTLSFLTHNRFQFTAMDQGKLYLFSGVLMATVQGGFVRRLKNGKESLYALLGLILIVPAFIFMGISSTVSQIYYSLALYAISSAMIVPCLTTVVSLNSPPEAKGAVMGTLRSLGALARAIGPCLASIIYWSLGSTSCYIFGAIALCWPLYSMRKLNHFLNGTAVYNETANKSPKMNGKTAIKRISPARAN